MDDISQQPAPLTGLELLRAPFSANQVSKLPKPFNREAKKGMCVPRKEGGDAPDNQDCYCGGYHGLPAMHLDYVGHAALTDRLLQVDPMWNWEPLSLDNGLPKYDANGGLWIRLTVCGHTRLGYGDAAGKSGPSAVKEIIGDALRNAAMRFGAALDLWHKGGDLHADDEPKKKGRGKGNQTTKEVFASLDRKTQEALEVIADKASSLMREGEAVEAWEHIRDQKLSTDELTGLWSLFDSGERSALKKADQFLKQQAPA